VADQIGECDRSCYAARGRDRPARARLSSYPWLIGKMEATFLGANRRTWLSPPMPTRTRRTELEVTFPLGRWRLQEYGAWKLCRAEKLCYNAV
jgi:hypothetical protein